ncbi:MAG: hypothetical protein AB7T49_06720 [Oligoflexales bacterium]
MRRNYLDFALLSEGRLETIDALFELEQLSAVTSWQDSLLLTKRSFGSSNQIDGLTGSIFNVIKKYLRSKKSQTHDGRGKDGNAKVREAIVT